MIDLSDAGQRVRDAVSDPPTAIAVLLERNRRRRTRRVAGRTAVGAALVAVVIGAVLATRPSGGATLRVQGSTPTDQAASRNETGVVTGRIARCTALPESMTGLSVFTGGTVVALNGTITQQTNVSGGRLILPADVVASQTVKDGQAYSFNLPKGNYVLHVTRYSDAPPGSNATSFVEVVVLAGQTIHVDMPNMCK